MKLNKIMNGQTFCGFVCIVENNKVSFIYNYAFNIKDCHIYRSRFYFVNEKDAFISELKRILKLSLHINDKFKEDIRRLIKKILKKDEN